MWIRLSSLLSFCTTNSKIAQGKGSVKRDVPHLTMATGPSGMASPGNRSPPSSKAGRRSPVANSYIPTTNRYSQGVASRPTTRTCSSATTSPTLQREVG